jgi:hypothetical protein
VASARCARTLRPSVSYCNIFVQVLSKGQEKHHKAAIALRRNQVKSSANSGNYRVACDARGL